MAISDLLAVVSPPDSPIGVGTAEALRDAESRLGIAFPPDYCEIALRYGTGQFLDNDRISVFVWSPYSQVDDMLNICDGIQQYKDSEGDEAVPYDVYPASPGLLVCASDVNGGNICWLTDGPPDRWPLILSYESGEYEQVDMPLTTFLAKAFTREIECSLWPEPLFTGPNRVIFTPE